jgi:hypothetical protein
VSAGFKVYIISEKKLSLPISITKMSCGICLLGLIDLLCLMPLSAISWRPVLVVEEAGVPGENHQPWASNW